MGCWPDIYETRGGPELWSLTVTCPMTRSDCVPTLEEAKAQFENSLAAMAGVGEAGGGGLKNEGPEDGRHTIAAGCLNGNGHRQKQDPRCIATPGVSPTWGVYRRTGVRQIEP